jgi:uncharacterized protein (TIGR04255 family)
MGGEWPRYCRECPGKPYQVKLRNPPVVEAWIEFHAQGSDARETWPQGLDSFFGEIRTEYPDIEKQVQEQFQVVERSPGGMPVKLAFAGELRRVRAFDQPRRRCVQVGRDTLVVNLIKGNEGYGGFEVLLPLAIAHFERFVRVFQPVSIKEAALHYTDLVRVPREPAVSARLEDLFRIGVQVPDEGTWPLKRVAVDISVSLPGELAEPDELVIGFRREAPVSSVSEDRFRLDWHVVCRDVETLSVDVLGKRLTQAHDGVRQRFRECFTEHTWSLFGEER